MPENRHYSLLLWTLLPGDLINVAPAPTLTRLDRLHDRVARVMKMFGGVLILRLVAATDVAAGAAQSQMHPIVSHRQTFLAPRGAGGDLVNLIEMRASRSHRFLFFQNPRESEK